MLHFFEHHGQKEFAIEKKTSYENIPMLVTTFHGKEHDATKRQRIHTGYWFPSETG